MKSFYLRVNVWVTLWYTRIIKQFNYIKYTRMLKQAAIDLYKINDSSTVGDYKNDIAKLQDVLPPTVFDILGYHELTMFQLQVKFYNYDLLDSRTAYLLKTMQNYLIRPHRNTMNEEDYIETWVGINSNDIAITLADFFYNIEGGIPTLQVDSLSSFIKRYNEVVTRLYEVHSEIENPYVNRYYLNKMTEVLHDYRTIYYAMIMTVINNE